MAIFPSLENEATVQVGDRTRLNASRSFVSPDTSILKVEIKPTASDDYIDVTEVDGYYLDWVYSSAATVVPTVRVTDAESVTATLDSSIVVISEATDALLATDQDLKVHESDIFDYLKVGRSSFKDVHRRARKLIIDAISLENLKNGSGNPITVDQIFDRTALKDWATYLALRLIFFDNTVSIDDRFERKADYYKTFEDQAKARALSSIQLDEDKDGSADNEIGSVNFSAVKLVRR